MFIPFRYFQSLLVGLFLFTASGLVAAKPITASVTINADKVIGSVNQLAFGHNIETADSAGIFGKTQKEKMLYGDGFWEATGERFSPVVLGKAQDLGIKALRYPGGCLVHNFDWRKAVGPRANRGDWQFGIEEYLALCKTLGAEPLMQVSDYVLPADEMPAHVAQLVEYLNAPATPDHPWAMKRAEWGHPEPHGVKWFELGNESDHGNHDVVPQRIYSPQAYAAYANATIAAMKAVDPTIKVGILCETSVSQKDFDGVWNRIVIGTAGPNADFVVSHYYLPGGIKDVSGNDDAIIAAYGASEIVEHRLNDLSDLIVSMTGRSLPVFITEYNAIFSTETRFSYGSALRAADALRLYIDPRNGVGMANYWQMFNGFFGSVRVNMKDPGAFTTKELGAYYLFKLWAQHFGATLVDHQLKSPKVEIDGNAGKALVFKGKTYIPSQSLATVSLAGKLTNENFTRDNLDAEVGQDGILSIRMKNFTGNDYSVIASVKNPAGIPAGSDYRVTYQARFIPDDPVAPKVSLGFGLCDPRGWAATELAVAIPGVESPDWTTFTDSIYSARDTTGMDFVVRIEPRDNKVSGTLEVRNASMEIKSKPVYPAYDMVTVSSSLSQNRDKLYAILFNKNPKDPVTLTMDVNGFPAAACARWEVLAPSILSVDGVRETVTNAPVAIDRSRTAKTVVLTLPPHSMTALEFSK